MADKNIYDILVNVRLAYKKAKIDKDFFSSKEFEKKMEEMNSKIKKSFESFVKEAKLDKIIQSQKENLEKMADNTKKSIENTMEKAKESVEKTKNTFKSFWQTPWGKFMGGFFKIYIISMMIRMIYNLGKALFDASQKLTQFNREYSQFMGRTEASVKALPHLINMANKYGVALNNINSLIRSTSSKNVDFVEALFGLSAISGQEIAEKVASVLENMKNRGKVSLDELNELARSGFYVWEELADKLGMTDEQLRNIEKSGIDVSKVIKVLENYFINYVKNNKNAISQTDKLVSSISNNWAILVDKLKNIFDPLLKLVNDLIVDLGILLGVNEYSFKLQKLSKDYNKIYSEKVNFGGGFEFEKGLMKLAYSISKIFAITAEKVNSVLIPNFNTIMTNAFKELDKYSNDIKNIFAMAGNKIYNIFGTGVIDYSQFQNILTKYNIEMDKFFNYFDSQNLSKIKNTMDLITNFFSRDILSSNVKKDVIENIKKLIFTEFKNLFPSEVLTVISNLLFKYNSSINDQYKIMDIFFGQFLAYLRQGLENLYGIKYYTAEAKKQIQEGIEQRPKTEQQLIDTQLGGAKYEFGLIDLLGNMLQELQYASENEISAFIDGIYEMFYEGFSSFFPDVYALIEKYIGIEKTGKLNYGAIMDNFYTILEEMLNALAKYINEINITTDEGKKNLEKANNLYAQMYSFMIKSLQENVKKEMNLRKEEINNLREKRLSDILNNIKLGLEDFFKEEEIEIVVKKSVIIEGKEYFYEEKEKMKTGTAIFDFSKIIDNYKQFLSIFTGFGNFGNLDILGNLGLTSFFLALSKIPNIQYLLNPLAATLEILATNIAPVLNDLLQPFIGLIASFGITLAQMIIPLLQMLFPIFNMLANVFAVILSLLRPILQSIIVMLLPIINILNAILVPRLKILNSVLLALTPVIKFVVGVFIVLSNVFMMFYNVIANIVNGFLWLINAITKAGIGYLQTYTINWDISSQIDQMMSQQQVSTSDLLAMATGEYGAYGYALSQGGSGGSGLTTEAKRPITININVENWFGDEEATRKLALIVKNEFEILGIL